MGIEHILFIIGTIILIILLVLAVVVVIISIVLLRKLQHLAQKIESATDTWTDLVRGVAKRVGPAAASGAVALIMKQWRKRKTKGEGDD